MSSLPEPFRFMGIQIHPVSKHIFVETVLKWASAKSQRRVRYVNVNAINIALDDPAFAESVNEGDLIFCDGYGAKWAGRLLGVNIPERLTVMDWIDDLLAGMAAKQISLYLLGDEPGVAEQCSLAMQREHPRLRIAGCHHGFFQKDGEENDQVVSQINAANPDVLMVGFGMPLQEKWIDDNRKALGSSVLISVGATFRWYAGAESRPPRWMTDHGLEWLGRFFTHPVKLFRRYVVGNARFGWRVMRAILRSNQEEG